MASTHTSFVLLSALALACVAMVPVAHAGAGVSTGSGWDAVGQRQYCGSGRGVYDEYRPRAAARPLAARPEARYRLRVVSRRYVIQRVETVTEGMFIRPTVVPAGSIRPDRSCVVSTSRSVRQDRRAYFEAKLVTSPEPAREVSAKQQDAAVKVASKSAK